MNTLGDTLSTRSKNHKINNLQDKESIRCLKHKNYLNIECIPIDLYMNNTQSYKRSTFQNLNKTGQYN
jgi:hypothetical protein